MTLVDSSVWIDYFNGRPTPETDSLHALLGIEPLAIGDLILMEVLQGFRSERDYRTAKRLLTSLPVLELLGCRLAIEAADHYRRLRNQGITVRKTVDVVIATFCIHHDHALLFSDRDFRPFVEFLGLRAAMPD